MNEERNYKYYEPFPEDKMGFKNKENTICELLRRTYELTDNKEVRLNIRIAMTMAKRMGEKLHTYRKMYQKDINA